MRVPGGVLKGAAAVVALGRGAAACLVLNPLDTTIMARRFFTNECAAHVVISGKMPGDVAELGGVILMDEEDVHRLIPGGGEESCR
jgi:hypothetical protein